MGFPVTRYPVFISLVLLLLFFSLIVSSAYNAPVHGADDTIPDHTLYLPLMANDWQRLNQRMGYGVTQGPLTRYPEIRALSAGWYVDWSVAIIPTRPGGIEHVQMVRVHQALTCGARHHTDRQLCGYVQPLDYTYLPDQATIEAAARANPGVLWLIGNEMDRLDWAYCVQWQGSHCQQVAYNGQDEILPETYAVAYHDLYQMIKAVDNTAQVAIGGIIQATPLRLQYLTQIWDQYQAIYTATMPVDVWNVHNFIIQEKSQSWGADIPPGISAQEGEYVGRAQTHIDMTIFAQQIRAFRQWMKDRGQQEKPLIVSEYGALYPNSLLGLPTNDPTPIYTFMNATFDYFFDTKDCTLGYTADECRLVQRWNWYSLDDTWGNFNPYSRLFDPNTTQITAIGERFRDYAIQQ